MAAACMAFAGVSSAATAASDTGSNKRFHAAWDALLAEEGHFLTPPQFAGLNSLAFQAAIVRICDNQKLDQDAFAQKLNTLIDGNERKLEDEQAEQRKAAIMVAFGARFGIFLAEGSQDKHAFCNSADELKQDASISVLMKK